MKTRSILAAVLLTAGVALAPLQASAQNREPAPVEVTIHADQPGPKINKNIYGQFAEHLGTGIYEGVWVGEGSPIPNTKGYRDDVIAALRDLKVPVVRWPGGCFADDYHWREGVGPRENRPVRVNAHWGGVPETNEFGTHEFMAFAEMIGAKVYISANVGSGTVQEMGDWLEYMTSDTQSALANERRRNGREEPWMIDYFGIGNETWGCGGNMRPEYYADLFRQYAAYVNIRTLPQRRPVIVASGGNDAGTRWAEVMSTMGGNDVHALSHHYYTRPRQVRWEDKGAAIGFGESEWISTLSNTMLIDDYITANVAVLDRNDPKGRTAFYVDEWGTWYDTEPGREPGFLYQQNSIRDGLVAALNFNIFHAHAERVQMTNIAQMVNVLQAMILTDGERMTLTPTYHVFHMYKPFQDATFLPTDIRTPTYTLGDFSVPTVDVTAARGVDGRIYFALVNLDPNREAVVRTDVTGTSITNAVGRVLTAPALDTHNTVDNPGAVTPAPYQARRDGDHLTLRLPPKSVVVVALD